MIKQTKFTSSITLSLGLLFLGSAFGQGGSAVDTFEDFEVEPATPYVDSFSAYQLTFNLSNDTYGRLHNSGLLIEFPRGFGLEAVDSVSLSTDHPGRQYRIERFSIDGEKLILRLKRVDGHNGGDSFDPGERRINFDIGIFIVHNPEVSGHFQLTATAYKRDDLIAGPSLSEPFEIIEIPVGPKPELQIISTELIAPNSPKVNTEQEVSIEVVVANVSEITAYGVVVKLSSDGESNIRPELYISFIEAHDSSKYTFLITAGFESDTEIFKSEILVRGSDVLEPLDDTAGAIIQTPANLVLSSSIADGDTIFVEGGQEYAFTFSIINTGQASVSKFNYLYDGIGGSVHVGAQVQINTTAPLVDIVQFHKLEITGIPIDLNTLQPALINDTEIQFTVIVAVPGDIDFERSFIVENNPFNPLDGPVTFVYNLAVASDVAFRIFTVTGEEVHKDKFIFGNQGGKAGTNQIQWDGRNDAGEMVLNGVYVTTIEVANTGEKASLKLAVLK